MQETGQPLGNPMSRPSTRVGGAPAPIQRGNYGLPPRPSMVQPMSRPAMATPAPVPAPVQTPEPVQQPAQLSTPQPAPQPQFSAPAPTPARPMPAPSTPQFMDFAPSRPQPQAAPVQQVTPTPVMAMPQPVQPQAAFNDVAPAPVAAQRPLFTPTPTKAEAKPEKAASGKFNFGKIFKIGLAVLAVGLIVSGGVRYVGAGSTANDTIAVGAVAANDGRLMTIQFTATDGKLHKVTVNSDRDLIPGSATEIAYRSGAPEATARQVSLIKGGRSTGMLLVLAGIVVGGVLGVVAIVSKLKARGKHRSHALTTTVTA